MNILKIVGTTNDFYIHLNQLVVTKNFEVVYMTPWFPWRRRRRFFDIFDDVDEDFQRMEDYMSRMIDEARKAPKPGEGGPFVYGFSMRVGPDGKPKIEEFGNVPGAKRQGLHEVTDEREPLTDVIEGEEEVTIIAEMPGITKDDINLEAGEESLSIKVDTEQRKYSKALQLPCKIQPDSTKANYKNGVLEVKLKRQEKKEKKKEVNVKVE